MLRQYWKNLECETSRANLTAQEWVWLPGAAAADPETPGPAQTGSSQEHLAGDEKPCNTHMQAYQGLQFLLMIVNLRCFSKKKKKNLS